MKVSCGECSASFVAPDDKIRGRLVKYRCRKCGATIVADGTTLEPEELEADEGELTSLPPPPRPSGESITKVRAASPLPARVEVPQEPPTIPLGPELLVPKEPPSIPLPLLDEKPAAPRPAPRATPKKPGGDTSAAFSLGPSEGASARRKPKAPPPPPPTEDPIVLPPLPVDEPPAPTSSGASELLVASADIEDAPPSSGRVDFSALVDAAPSTQAPATFDWGGTLDASFDAPAPAPLWETPAPEKPAPEKPAPAKIEPLLSVSPVAAKPAHASGAEEKKAPGWVWAAGALCAAGVAYLLFGRASAPEPAPSPARAVAPAKTSEAPPPEPVKTADPAPTPTAHDEPKKDEPAVKEEPKKEEPKQADPLVKDEPRRPEPVAKEEPKKDEPKQSDPVAKDEPRKPDAVAKEEPKKDEPKPAVASAEFDKGAARAALGAAAAASAGCAQPDGPRGTGTVRVTFSTSGRATQALIQGPPFAGTPTGSCIASKFRGLSISPFTGDAVSVTKSVTIQ